MGTTGCIVDIGTKTKLNVFLVCFFARKFRENEKKTKRICCVVKVIRDLTKNFVKL